MPQFETTWQAPEFEYRHKDISWYWISIITAVLILAAAIWLRNFLFGFFIVIAEILFIVWGGREPRTVDFKLTEKGLTIGNRKFYQAGNIENFSLDYHPDEKWETVVLHFKQKLQPTLRITVPKNQFMEIRKALTTIAPEVEHHESLLEALEKFFRF